MEDLTNKKFGLLTVIGRDSTKTKCNSRNWICRCECGGTAITQGYNLKRGNTKSCGCLLSIKNRGNKNPTWKGFEEISASKLFEYKRNAKRRNLQFSVTPQELWEQFLKQNRKCSLTGLLLTFPQTVGDRTATASLDRIDNNKGYTKDNIQWLHKEINYMKSDLATEKFIEFCKMVVQNINGAIV